MADQARIDAHRAFARCFGKNLLRARRAAGMSQEALGFESDLHRTEIGMLERGTRVPRLDTAVKLASSLGISLDDLAEGVQWRAAVRTGGWFAAAGGDAPNRAFGRELTR
jgi:transcriptional regulator with XRE-family HTH domain